jgi:hypothetical protein
MEKDQFIATLQQIKAIVDQALEESCQQQTPLRKARREKGYPAPKTAILDYEVNARAFVKAHARGLSGPKQFVLLMAYLAKGKVGKEVQFQDIRNHWNRMKSLIGNKLNTFFPNSAKEHGWINPREKGVYVLTKSWQEALKK